MFPPTYWHHAIFSCTYPPFPTPPIPRTATPQDRELWQQVVDYVLVACFTAEFLILSQSYRWRSGYRPSDFSRFSHLVDAVLLGLLYPAAFVWPRLMVLQMLRAWHLLRFTYRLLPHDESNDIVCLLKRGVQRVLTVWILMIYGCYVWGMIMTGYLYGSMHYCNDVTVSGRTECEACFC